MADMKSLIDRTINGDLAAYAQIVELTQRMVYAVCRRLLPHHEDALDATQETYAKAFQRLSELYQADALPGWLRRIAVNSALNIARKKRFCFIQPDGFADVPIFDESETTWSDAQRQALGQALLKLTPEERRICDRFYHGGWDITRLARDANITETAMRKRLQRIRDQLREDAEMNERQHISIESLPADLPAQVIELLNRPRLTDLPENPVGKITDLLRTRYAAFQWIDLPEVVNVEDARKIGDIDPHHLNPDEIHFVDPTHFLRYDTSLPLLIAAANIHAPVRLIYAGKVYRNQSPTPARDQAFHQFELLHLDAASAIDPWNVMGQALHLVSDILPGRNTQIEKIDFPLCKSAWEIAVNVKDQWVAVLAWGIYSDAVLRYLGADPTSHTAIGFGIGLERLAALHFGFDDIRKLAAATV